MAAKIMLIAGDPSGDALAAELVRALIQQAQLQSRTPPEFLAAGGSHLAAANVRMIFDLTAHSVIGLWEVVKNYVKFRRIFNFLLDQAFHEKPDLILCVDFSGFNRRFAHAVRERIRSDGEHSGWKPRIVQFVSPQVWASRPGRARSMASDFDLLLSIFPFEKEWYNKYAPELKVTFVGHPIFDRFPNFAPVEHPKKKQPSILLLPGSRPSEIQRHLPPMVDAWQVIKQQMPSVSACMVLPTQALTEQASKIANLDGIRLQIGDLPSALARTSVAIASTGTVTMECAFFGVPTIALYKTSWGTYHIAKRIIRIKYLAMPNILANETIYPEYIQDDASAENLAQASLDILRDHNRQIEIKKKLATIIKALGSSGACRRAALAVYELLDAR